MNELREAREALLAALPNRWILDRNEKRDEPKVIFGDPAEWEQFHRLADALDAAIRQHRAALTYAGDRTPQFRSRHDELLHLARQILEHQNSSPSETTGLAMVPESAVYQRFEDEDLKNLAARVRKFRVLGVREAMARELDLAQDFLPPQPEINDELMDRLAAGVVGLVGDDSSLRMLAVANDDWLTVGDKQQRIYAIDHGALGWKSKKWSELIGCSDRQARNTDWWKVDRKRLRRR